MGHEDAGHYAAKHPQGTEVNPDLEKRLREKVSDGKISCAAAHGIAGELGVQPSEVGVAIDLMEARIEKCQLGLFGYQPEKRIVRAAGSPSPEIQSAIRADLVDGRMACVQAWKIAERFGEKRWPGGNKVCLYRASLGRAEA